MGQQSPSGSTGAPPPQMPAQMGPDAMVGAGSGSGAGTPTGGKPGGAPGGGVSPQELSGHAMYGGGSGAPPPIPGGGGPQAGKPGKPGGPDGGGPAGPANPGGVDMSAAMGGQQMMNNPTSMFGGQTGTGGLQPGTAPPSQYQPQLPPPNPNRWGPGEGAGQGIPGPYQPIDPNSYMTQRPDNYNEYLQGVADKGKITLPERTAQSYGPSPEIRPKKGGK
jgi:hypothetical protein